MSKKKTFYGQREVLGVSEIEKDRVKLVLSEGNPIELPKKMFEVVQTKKPIQEGELRDERLIPVANQILVALLEWDIKVDEVGPLMDRIVVSVNEFTAAAEDARMGNLRSERTMKQIDSILRDAKDETKAESPTDRTSS